MTFIEEAQAKFAELITSELARIEAMKQAGKRKIFRSRSVSSSGSCPATASVQS